MQEIVDVAEWNSAVTNKMYCLVCFSAKWCSPCKTLKPMIESLSNYGKYPGVNFFQVDVDKNEELSRLCNITSLPTILILKSGIEYKRIVGSNYSQIIADLDSLE